MKNNNGQSMTETITIVVKQLIMENERAGIILGAAQLDAQLERILKKFIMPYFNQKHDMFDFNGPLGTFSSRINMCFSLMLIDRTETEALHLIRSIRNDCSHEVFIKFEGNQSYKDKIKNLKDSMVITQTYEDIEAMFKEEGINPELSEIFTIITVQIVNLEVTLSSIKSIYELRSSAKA